jgi:hypothetical protein
MFLVALDKYFHVGLCQHVGVVLVTSQKTLGSSLYESFIKGNDLLIDVRLIKLNA